MKTIINRDKEQYFLDLAEQGAQLPPHFKAEDIIAREEETPMTLITKQMQAMQMELQKLKKEKETPNTRFSLNTIYPFPFDRDLYLPPFPCGVEIP
jgi:hypothetical protein